VDEDVFGTDGTVSADVREFFAAFSAASDRDPAGPAGLFGEQFLSLDPNSMTVVNREQLAELLPMRARMFAFIGAHGTELSELSECPVDAQHTLVRTAWAVRFDDPATESLTLRSSFLLHRAPEGWRVAVYLNHSDLGALIRERQQAGDPDGDRRRPAAGSEF
jgi:hypothetical protein